MMHQGVMSETKANSFFPAWVRQRELRQHTRLGYSDSLYRSLYSSIAKCHSWGGGQTSRSEYGGLFSLEFSPDGSLLVAGCEKSSFLVLDPLSRRLISTVHHAHDSSITHVKFLDSRIFATGGVDGTISLWDTRNLKSRFRSLLGHAYTIGNIEFSQKNDLLITSAVDGIICIWDMKNLNQRREFYKKTFWSHILLRLRLNPDESKMIISTASGYLLIVHELDLNTLVQDLDEFEMEMFGWAHLDPTISTVCQNWSRSLSQNRRRNRMEKVADFPNADGFNVISALEIHPQGWSVFSRCTMEATKQEWTCVHDIQERECLESGAVAQGGSGNERPSSPQDDAGTAKRLQVQRISKEKCSASEEGGTGSLLRSNIGFCTPSTNDFGPELPDAAFPLEGGVCKEDTARRSPPPGPSSAPPHPLEPAGLGSNAASFPFEDPSLSRFNSCVAQSNRRAYVRFPRLTHYIEESYSSNWYTESLGVSADGRLVCSPFRRGIRCLAFSPECSEQSVSWCGIKPRPLYVLSTHTSHSRSVICTKISPRHCVLVSGSLDGKLAWYQPVV